MGIHNCYNGTRELSDHEKFVERRDAAKHVVRQERARAAQIFAHPNVLNGTAIQLANFLVTQTDMPADEACATLDKAHAGEPEKVHHAGGLYEMGAQADEHLLGLHPIERDRREKQALNDAAFVEANHGMVSVGRRSDRDKEKDKAFAEIARGCRNRDDTASPNKPGNKKSDEESDDEAGLRAMGFNGSPFDRGGYEAGAAAAARILGKPTSHTAPRPANPSYARERPAPATRLPSPDAAHAQGAESAKRLLFGSGAVRAELDAELHQRYAEQQRARAHN